MEIGTRSSQTPSGSEMDTCILGVIPISNEMTIRKSSNSFVKICLLESCILILSMRESEQTAFPFRAESFVYSRLSFEIQIVHCCNFTWKKSHPGRGDLRFHVACNPSERNVNFRFRPQREVGGPCRAAILNASSDAPPDACSAIAAAGLCALHLRGDARSIAVLYR